MSLGLPEAWGPVSLGPCECRAGARFRPGAAATARHSRALVLAVLGEHRTLTLPQIEALAIVAGMLALFVSDRLRYDIVAALALSAAIITGVVPASRAFLGFANPVIIIIASVLVLSRAIEVSGVIERVMRRLLRLLPSTTLQVGALTAAVTALSAFMKNVGALGLFMPIALQAARRRDRPASRYLMPLSFGSLIGGTITEIGTSPNLLISTVRQQVLGHPYRMFDFAPVGLPLSVLAVGFLAFGWRLLPKREGQATAEARSRSRTTPARRWCRRARRSRARLCARSRRWARATSR